MAEAAATVIGIAGVVSVLQSLLQCYKDFLVARDFGEDFGHLKLHSEIDQQSIEDGKRLFGRLHGRRVSAYRYLQEETQLEVIGNQARAGSTDSASRSTVLVAEKGKQSVVSRANNKFSRMLHRTHDEQHPGTIKRTVWALVDKTRLEATIDKVQVLVDHLNTDFAPVNRQLQLDTCIQEFRGLKLDKDEITELSKVAGDHISKTVLEMLSDKSGVGFKKVSLTKDATLNAGDLL